MFELDLSAIHAAARALEEGRLVAFPTETVYGLGADAERPEAVAQIYAAKGRPSNHPVIVHVAPEADIGYWVAEVPDAARQLINAFWPGPLTLILKRAAHIPDAVSGGQDSVGLRCPSHPVAQALLQQFKGGRGGVAAPSANKFGHVSPTTAQHVRDEFGTPPVGPLACILDGGQSQVGIESTIVDLSRMTTHGAVLLRPGQISTSDMEAVLGHPLSLPDNTAPRASGTLEAHYAPRTPVALVDATDLSSTLTRLQTAGRRVAVIAIAGAAGAILNNVAAMQQMPATAEGYAYDLYAALRAMDAVGADIIIVETPPASSAWQGVNDRLRRAAYDSRNVLTRLLGV